MLCHRATHTHTHKHPYINQEQEQGVEMCMGSAMCSEKNTFFTNLTVVLFLETHERMNLPVWSLRRSTLNIVLLFKSALLLVAVAFAVAVVVV